MIGMLTSHASTRMFTHLSLRTFTLHNTRCATQAAKARTAAADELTGKNSINAAPEDPFGDDVMNGAKNISNIGKAENFRDLAQLKR